jgi:probable HAF family extracellular repeat protein
MRRSVFIVLGITLLMIATVLPVAAGEQSGRAYAVTDLGTLGGSEGDARGINNHGQIVGLSRTQDGRNLGYLYEHGEMTALYPPTGSNRWSPAVAVNERGQIVGQASITTPSGSNRNHAFMWHDGVWTDLIPDNIYGAAHDINDAGDIIGARVLPGGGRLKPFLLRNGTFDNLVGMGSASGINNRGQIVGSAPSAAGPNHAHIWTDGVMTDIGSLSDGYSSGTDISDSGYVVGSSQSATGQTHAFIWDRGVMTDLGTLGGLYSHALGINNVGVIVGSASTETETHAVMWALAN